MKDLTLLGRKKQDTENTAKMLLHVFFSSNTTGTLIQITLHACTADIRLATYDFTLHINLNILFTCSN